MGHYSFVFFDLGLGSCIAVLEGIWNPFTVFMGIMALGSILSVVLPGILKNRQSLNNQA